MTETSLKYHDSCRYTHPAAGALLQFMHRDQLEPRDTAVVITPLHQGAHDVLGPVLHPDTVRQSKFSMGTVPALAAQYGHADLVEFEQHFLSETTHGFRDKLKMRLDA